MERSSDAVTSDCVTNQPDSTDEGLSSGLRNRTVSKNWPTTVWFCT